MLNWYSLKLACLIEDEGFAAVIEAITFDLWDTIIHDDSDEAKRAAQGLRSKKDERRHLVWSALNRLEPIEYDTVARAYDVADAAFNHVWHEQHITWTVNDRLGVLLKGLARTLPKDEFRCVVQSHEEMEVTIMPDPIAGISFALNELAKHYKLAVVSDAIVSPGRCLKRWLAQQDLDHYFDGFAFSDEVGHSKPHRRMFECAAEQLGVQVPNMLHVGDRDQNDVKGPQALGMKAILFTGTRDVDKDKTSADAICSRHQDLPEIISRVAAE